MKYLEKRKLKSKLSNMTFSATKRCPCGYGLAYDKTCMDEDSPFKMPFNGYWDCAGIILGIADGSKQHTAKLPFTFYEIKSENQPSANGMTTRVTLADVLSIIEGEK